MQRILVLTGPAGSAKTTTIRVLSKEMEFEISEWRSSAEGGYSDDDYGLVSLIELLELR